MKAFRLHGHHVGWEKHRYLLQLVSTCIALILFPCIMSLIVVSRQSYVKLTNTYQSYYMEISERFANYFTKQLNDICLSSYVIADDSRDPNKSAFCLDQPILKQQSFYLYPAIQTIAEHTKSTPSLFGIYYYGIDRVLTKTSSFSSRSFAGDYLKIDDPPYDTPQLKAFFFPGDASLVFYPFRSSGNRNSLLVGVHTKIGQSRTLVMLIYKLDGSSVDTSLLTANNPSKVQFSVLNGDLQPLISFGPEYYETPGLSDQLKNCWSGGEDSITLQADSQKYIISICKEPTTGFTYILTTPLDQAANGTQEFYIMNMKVMFLLCVVLLFAIILLIYINYRPIVGLLKKLNKREKGTNEFEAISEEINRMTNEISEQNMVIVDSLLGNILYGIPISDRMVTQIGIPADSCCFFVFTLSSGTIDTTQRTEITAKLSRHFSTKAYITDILFQDLTVLICMSTEDCKSRIFEFLNGYFKLNSASKAELRQGTTVSSLNDIMFSFSSCFPGILKTGFSESAGVPGKKSLQLPQDPTSKLMQQIAQYIESRFTDPSLSQSSVADYFQISTYSLSRLFKNKFGIVFTEYVTGKRIRMAQELLTENHEAVSVIAARVGIPNVNYFYKVFKTYTGISPLKYRNGTHENVDEKSGPRLPDRLDFHGSGNLSDSRKI